MVGIMLVPGLSVQAQYNRATARRLAQVEQAFFSAAQERTIPLHFEDETGITTSPNPSRLMTWLDQAVTKVFTRHNLATSLQQAGLGPADLDWIADQEYAQGASFGIPKRQATKEELLAVLHKAWGKHNP